MAEIMQAESLLGANQLEAVVADKRYDSDVFIAAVEALQARQRFPCGATESSSV